VERQSSKHSPRLDDELKKETESLVRGAPVESRVQEHREAEPAADFDREATVRTAPAWRLGPDEASARRELSRHLRLSVFPAGRRALIAEARENDAPQPVLDVLAGLPDDRAFVTVYEVWAALTEPESEPERERGHA
jgi:hypothetical protein